MKKTFFTLMLILASVVTINAQSLTGKTWIADLSEDGDKTIANLTFNDDGSMTMKLDVSSVEDAGGMQMIILVDANVPGTYTLDGDKLSINFDAKKADMKCDVDLKGLDDATKAMYKGMILGEINKQKASLLDEILGSLPFIKSPIMVKSITDTALNLEIEGQAFELKAVNDK